MKEALKAKAAKVLSNSKDISFDEVGELYEHICAGEVQIEDWKEKEVQNPDHHDDSHCPEPATIRDVEVANEGDGSLHGEFNLMEECNH